MTPIAIQVAQRHPDGSPTGEVVERQISVPKYALWPMATIGLSNAGPMPNPVFIGPSVRKPRWWQPWRWHQYPRWRRESSAAWQKYLEVFGAPADTALARKLRAFFEEPLPPLRVVRVPEGSVSPEQRAAIEKFHQRHEPPAPEAKP